MLKILTVIILVAILATPGFHSTGVQAQASTCIQTSTQANIRSSASTHSAINGKIGAGSVVQFYALEGEWYRIDNGYVFNGNWIVQVGCEAFSSQSPEQTTVTAGNSTNSQFFFYNRPSFLSVAKIEGVARILGVPYNTIIYFGDFRSVNSMYYTLSAYMQVPASGNVSGFMAAGDMSSIEAYYGGPVSFSGNTGYNAIVAVDTLHMSTNEIASILVHELAHAGGADHGENQNALMDANVMEVLGDLAFRNRCDRIAGKKTLYASQAYEISPDVSAQLTEKCIQIRAEFLGF